MHHKRQGTQVTISTGMKEDGGPLSSRVRALPLSPHKHRNVNKLNFKQNHVLGGGASSLTEKRRRRCLCSQGEYHNQVLWSAASFYGAIHGKPTQKQPISAWNNCLFYTFLPCLTLSHPLFLPPLPPPVAKKENNQKGHTAVEISMTTLIKNAPLWTKSTWF